MFAKFASTFLLASTLFAGAFAKPVPVARELVTRTDGPGHVSFNNWHGISSFGNFDDFFGADNFDSSVHFSQVVEQSQQVVCRTQAVEIIQQRLIVLQEMAKRIITEQICEVETQTVVFEQFHASLGNFRHDLIRGSGHQVGYDRAIASHFNNICLPDGSLSSDNFGFKGTDLGAHTVVVGGSNWNDATSPASVSAALGAANLAVSGH